MSNEQGTRVEFRSSSDINSLREKSQLLRRNPAMPGAASFFSFVLLGTSGAL